MRKIVIKRGFLFASWVRKKGIDLGVVNGTDELESVKLEGDVRRLTCGDEPPRAKAHLETPSTRHQVLRLRRRRAVRPKVEECLLQSRWVLIHRWRWRIAAPVI